MEMAIVFIDHVSLKRSITGKIIDLLLRTGLDLVGVKMMVPDKNFIEKFCKIKKCKISRDYVKYKYLGKRIMVVVLRGDNAIEKVKNIAGKLRTNKINNNWKGTTIRGMFYGGYSKKGIFLKLFENVIQIASDKNEAEKLIELVWGEYRDQGRLSFLKGYELKPDEERTFIILKPETMKFRLIGKVIDDLSRSGLYVVGAMIVKPDKKILEKHYYHLKDKPFFPKLLEYMSSSNLMLMVYQGPKGEVVKTIKDIVGKTNPAKAEIGTIRRSYGHNKQQNVIHASDSPENTERELKIWDQENKIVS